MTQAQAVFKLPPPDQKILHIVRVRKIPMGIHSKLRSSAEVTCHEGWSSHHSLTNSNTTNCAIPCFSYTTHTHEFVASNQLKRLGELCDYQLLPRHGQCPDFNYPDAEAWAQLMNQCRETGSFGEFQPKERSDVFVDNFQQAITLHKTTNGNYILSFLFYQHLLRNLISGALCTFLFTPFRALIPIYKDSASSAFKWFFSIIFNQYYLPSLMDAKSRTDVLPSFIFLPTLALGLSLISDWINNERRSGTIKLMAEKPNHYPEGGCLMFMWLQADGIYYYSAEKKRKLCKIPFDQVTRKLKKRLKGLCKRLNDESQTLSKEAIVLDVNLSDSSFSPFGSSSRRLVLPSNVILNSHNLNIILLEELRNLTHEDNQIIKIISILLSSLNIGFSFGYLLTNSTDFDLDTICALAIVTLDVGATLLGCFLANSKPVNNVWVTVMDICQHPRQTCSSVKESAKNWFTSKWSFFGSAQENLPVQQVNASEALFTSMV